jgi:drug/metabolite transporter (DMT)-like permease
MTRGPSEVMAGYAMIAVAAVSWGLNGLFLRAAERFQPIHAALEGAVVLGSAALFFGIPALLRHGLGGRPAWGWAALALVGVADGLNTVFFFAAVQKTTLAVAVLCHYLAPVLVAAASPWLLRTKSSRRTWAALAVALLGLALLLEPWRQGANAKWAGAAFGLASAVFFASNIVLMKKVQKWFSPLEVLGYHALAAALFLCAFIPKGGYLLGAAPLLALVVQGVLLAGFSGLLFLRGLARVRADHASVLLLLEPVTAVIVGAVVWGEVPGPFSGAGAVLILAGAWSVLRSPEPKLAGAADLVERS